MPKMIPFTCKSFLKIKRKLIYSKLAANAEPHGQRQIIVRVSSTKLRRVVSLSHIQAKYNEGFMAN